jgi:hypothetical protein
MNPPALITKRRLKSIAPLQLGKILSILYGALGLLIVPVFLVMALVTPQMPESQRAGFAAFGIGFALLAPVLYGAMGFITGVLGAAIYNLVAKWVGGIEVEVE